MVFNLVFPENTILSYFFLFSLINNFLVPAMIAQIFIPTTELAIPTGTPTSETNAEIEAQPLTA